MITRQFDQRALVDRFGPEAKFEDILKDLEADVEILGEVICGIELNGERIDEHDEPKYFNSSVADIQQLKVVTGRPRNLVQGVVSNWVETIPQLTRSAEEVSEVIRFEGLNQAGSTFTDLIDVCTYLVDSLILIKSNFTDLEWFQQIVETWETKEKELSGVVHEIVAAMEQADRNLIADLIEYDLCNCIDEWHKLLKKSQAKLFEGLVDESGAVDRAGPTKTG